MRLQIHKMTIVASVIFLLSLIRIAQTTQLHPDPPVGQVPEHLLFNTRTIDAADEYNEKPLTVIGIFPTIAPNPTNPTTPLRPGRKYKRVVCPPGFTRAGDIIPGLDSAVPSTLDNPAIVTDSTVPSVIPMPAPTSNDPSVEHVTATDTGGGTTPNSQVAASSTPSSVFPPASPVSPPVSPSVSSTNLGGDQRVGVAALSSVSRGLSTIILPSSVEPTLAVTETIPFTGIDSSGSSASSDPIVSPTSLSTITPSDTITGGHFDHQPPNRTSQDTSDSSITTDPIITVTPPTTTSTTSSNSGSTGQHTDAPIVVPVVVSITTTQGPTPSTLTPGDVPSSIIDAPTSPPPPSQDTTTGTSTYIPTHPIATLPPTTTTTPNDPSSAVQVTSTTPSSTSDPPTETTTSNPPSNLLVTESVLPTTSAAAQTTNSSNSPSPPKLFIRQAITDPNACIPIPDTGPTDTSTGGQTNPPSASTDGVSFSGSHLQLPSITQSQSTPITTQITFTTSESGTLRTGVTIVTITPSVQEIQPVPITTQVTLTTSISGTLQTVVTLVTTTPPPISIEQPQVTTTQITFTTSESGTLRTVVTVVTTTPSLTNPTTESITYVTSISGTAQTMVTVITEEALIGIPTATTTTTIPLSLITIMLDWPVPTTTSQSGFGGSFSTYREGITFWIGILFGFIIIGVWF